MPNAIQEKLGSDAVNAEGVLAVQESMKMELNIRAPWDGTNIRSLCKEDNMVERHSHVITIEPLEHSVEVWPTRQTTQTTTRCTVSDFPEHVEFHEEGPREGFQIEKTMYPLEERAALVDALSETGLTQIQVASFVNPKAVPAMADADRLFAAINRKPGVRYTALWLNEKGFHKAAATPGVDLDGKLMFYATDGLSLRNNNCTADVMHERQIGWADLYAEHGVPLESAYIMAAFGCNFEGPVPLSRITDIARFMMERFTAEGRPIPRIYLADTVGWANPEEVKRRIAAVRDIAPEARIGLHLHDTRGLGGANVYAALQMGVDLFDSSVAGLGGCPFANHGDTSAAGNVCTEDMVYLCAELGIETGIDIEALVEAGRLAERIIGRKLNGKLVRNGTLEKYRRKAV